MIWYIGWGIGMFAWKEWQDDRSITIGEMLMLIPLWPCAIGAAIGASARLSKQARNQSVFTNRKIISNGNNPGDQNGC